MELLRRGRIGAVAVVAAAALALTGCSSGESTPSGSKTTNLAVILSNMQDPFWQTVQCGMQQAAVKYAKQVNVKYYTTPTYDSASIQSSFNAAKITSPDGVFLQVVQPTQLVSETRTLMQKGVPVVGMSGQDPNQLLDVFTSDFDSTPLIASFLKSIPKNGEVAVLGGQSTVPQVTSRYLPLLKAVKEQRPDVKVLPIQYTDFDVTKATNIATAFFVGNPHLTNILGTSGPDATGVLAAMKQAKMAPGKVNFWGWDANPDTIQGVKAGYISHLYSQNALQKGYEAVVELKDEIASNTGHSAITPKPESKWTSAPLGDLTAANIDSPASAKYLAVTTASCPYFKKG